MDLARLLQNATAGTSAGVQHNAPAGAPTSAEIRKRPAAETAEQLAEISCPCVFHRVLEVFPKADEATLAHEIGALRQLGLPDHEILNTLNDRLITSGGNFPQLEIQNNPVQRIICPRQNAPGQSVATAKGKGRGKNSNPPKKSKPAPKTLADKVAEHRHLLLDQAADPNNPDNGRVVGWIRGRIEVLMDMAVGIQKVSLDAILRKKGYSLTLAMLAVIEGLALREPELAQLMFKRRQVRNREHCELSRGPRVVYIPINQMNTKISLMKIWRPFRRRQLADPALVQAVAAIDGFLDAIDIDAQPDVDAPEELEADDTLGDISNTSADMEDGEFECQCCFSGYAFHCLVQCMDGHLFCKSCLREYAKSAISGESKSVLSCMAPECKEPFPRAQLEAGLSSRTLALLDEREQEESVRLATSDTGDDEKLSHCPHCTFKCYLPPGNKVLECLNDDCGRSTCMACGEDWDAHFGIPCREMEKKDEANVRKTAEEKMTAALLRRCHKCQTPLIKEEGCNKLTCRCGAKMCYICRASIKDYSHFCNHPRDPGKSCDKCKACSLWSNPKEDDERAIEEIRQQAEKEKAEKGFINDRTIGTKSGPAGQPNLNTNP